MMWAHEVMGSHELQEITRDGPNHLELYFSFALGGVALLFRELSLTALRARSVRRGGQTQWVRAACGTPYDFYDPFELRYPRLA